jgi:hypothetical protein
MTSDSESSHRPSLEWLQGLASDQTRARREPEESERNERVAQIPQIQIVDATPEEEDPMQDVDMTTGELVQFLPFQALTNMVFFFQSTEFERCIRTKELELKIYVCSVCDLFSSCALNFLSSVCGKPCHRRPPIQD